jgi:hypothetical protein
VSADPVLYAEQLRQYAEHFVVRDWNYTRQLGGLQSIKYDDPWDYLRNRIKRALGYLFQIRKSEWEKIIKVNRFRMAWYTLQRDKHRPDGVLDGGSIITHWEETGEYLQYVQPSVGLIVAKFMTEQPENPYAQMLADEMKRINDAYGERIEQWKVPSDE